MQRENHSLNWGIRGLYCMTESLALIYQAGDFYTFGIEAWDSAVR